MTTDSTYVPDPEDDPEDVPDSEDRLVFARYTKGQGHHILPFLAF